MADKTLTITVKDGGGDDGDKFSKDFDDSVRKAEAVAERTDNLLGTFIADTYGSTGSPEDFVKPKGKPGRPAKEVEEEEEKAVSKFKKINVILDNMQKVVIALNGVNGRITKATAVFNRSIKFVTKAVDDYSKKVEEAAGDPNDPEDPEKKVAEKSKEVATKFAKVAAATGSVVSVIGTVVAGFTALTAVTYLAGKIMTTLIDKMQELVGEFSAALSVQKAVTEVALIERQMRAAGRVGGELAALEANNNRELKVAMQDLLTEITDLISGPLGIILELISAMAETLSTILMVVNAFIEFFSQLASKVLELLSYLPLVGKIAAAAKKWVDADKIAEADIQITSLVDPLGDLGGLNFRPGEVKSLRKGGFLPPKK